MNQTFRAGRLRVDYNEVGSTRGDLEAICRVFRSTKLRSGGQIGKRGPGSSRSSEFMLPHLDKRFANDHTPRSQSSSSAT